MANDSKKKVWRSIIVADEYFSSFFSAIISNIPISLIVTVDKYSGKNKVGYWICFACAIVFSCISAIVLLSFSITKVHIKDKARKAYDDDIYKVGQSIERLYQTHLEEEYDKKYICLSVLFVVSMVCLLVALGALMGLWLIK